MPKKAYHSDDYHHATNPEGRDREQGLHFAAEEDAVIVQLGVERTGNVK